MSLLEKASEVLQNFDPKTDTVSDFTPVPDGTYTCVIDEVENKVSSKGTEFILITLGIIDGAHSGSKLFYSIYFSENTLVRGIKTIVKVMDIFGYSVPEESFESLETLKTTVSVIIGEQCNVKKVTNNNFPNYEILGQ